MERHIGTRRLILLRKRERSMNSLSRRRNDGTMELNRGEL